MLKLTQLTYLNLDNNKLRSLPNEIGKLTQLTRLYLDNNQLQSLPSEIGNLTQLTNIFLYNNQLRSLPSDIGNLTQLTNLKLGNNQLQSLPAEIRNLTQLTYLSLGNNQLQSLPAEIGNLTQLTDLSLYNNQLQILPSEIGKLTELTDLSLYNNQLQILPNELAQLSARCNINLELNSLSEQTIRNFQNLISQQRLQNPLLGPQISFSIREAPASDAFLTPQEAITFWTQEFQVKFPEDNTQGNFEPLLKSSDAENLLTFLDKLRRTKDFTTSATQANFVWRVNLVLRDACINDSFREQFFWLVKEALSSCNDRPTIYFGQIELQRIFLCESPQQELLDCAHLVIGAERLSLLEKKVSVILKTKQFRDDIEAILYCQIQLKEPLVLPISSEGMLHAGVAGITKEELEGLASSILAETSKLQDQTRILLASSFWEERVEKKYPEFAALHDEATGKLLNIPVENDAEYKLKSEQLQKELEEKKKALVHTKTQEWIKDLFDSQRD